ncbi:MAG: hypothetical protein ACYCXN_14175 [Acidimicrobiales bacterium]
MQAPALEPSNGLYRFSCPRCDKEVAERFYGPCSECREQLNETAYRPPAAGEDIERQRFEPKMNVVPNDVTARVERDEPEEDDDHGD